MVNEGQIYSETPQRSDRIPELPSELMYLSEFLMESGQIKVGSHGTRSVRGVYRASSPLVKYQGLVNDPTPPNCGNSPAIPALGTPREVCTQIEA
jgi:hypothetical protein